MPMHAERDIVLPIPSVRLSVRLSICPYVCPSVRLSVSLSVCPSVRQSVRLSVYLMAVLRVNKETYRIVTVFDILLGASF